MAEFPAAIKTFTNPISTDHMNTLSHAQQHAEANDEITAIQTALGVNLASVAGTTWTNYFSTSTVVGWGSYIGTNFIYTKKIGSTVFVNFYIYGNSNSAEVTFTLPYTNHAVSEVNAQCGYSADASGAATGVYVLRPSEAKVTCYKGSTLASWTASGTKLVTGQFFYEVA
jgi:hypothetical protein